MHSSTITRRLKDYFAHTKHPIQFAYLFGSVARGQALPFSDVDVAVYLDERVKGDPYKLLAPVVGEVMRTLHRDDVDLVCLNTVPPTFAFSVLGSGRLLSSRDETLRARAEAQIMQRYYDEMQADEEYDQLQDARMLGGKMFEQTPEMIDRKSVRKRLSYMAKMGKRLERFRQMARQDFLKNQDFKELAHHEMQTCIEALADICTHIVAATGLERPDERRDAPLILGRAKILPYELAEKLAEAISMRNVLVHAYLRIDYRKLYDAVQRDLPYFAEFGKHITEYLTQIETRERSKKKRATSKK